MWHISARWFDLIQPGLELHVVGNSSGDAYTIQVTEQDPSSRGWYATMAGELEFLVLPNGRVMMYSEDSEIWLLWGHVIGRDDDLPSDLTFPEDWHTSSVEEGPWQQSGYPNWDTQEVGYAFEGNWGGDVYDKIAAFMQTRPTQEQFEMWTLENIIGPYNAERQTDANEWNAIPEHDRLDHSWESLKDKSPEAADLVSQLGGGGGDVSDVDLNDTIIDIGKLDWALLYQYALEDFGQKTAGWQPGNVTFDQIPDVVLPQYRDGVQRYLVDHVNHLVNSGDLVAAEKYLRKTEVGQYDAASARAIWRKLDEVQRMMEAPDFVPEWMTVEANAPGADSWTTPSNTHTIMADPTGNADGLDMMQAPGRQPRIPCFCDVGMGTPHEWAGSCEKGDRPTMQYEAAMGSNWVYIEGQVSFGRHWFQIAQDMLLSSGTDEETVAYVTNMLARNTLPTDMDIAIGSTRNGRVQIWESTLDRNAVWDAVSTAKAQDPNS